MLPRLVLSFSGILTTLVMTTTHEQPPPSDEEQPTFDDVAERLFNFPQRDLSFYAVLFIAVIPLWSVVPIAWAVVGYSLHTGAVWDYGWKGWALFAVALVEASAFLAIASLLV